MKNIFRARRSLKSMYTANAIVQLLIYFLIAFAVSEFRMRILLLPFKSPLIVLILILSLIGASALTSVSTHVEFEEISKLSKSMNAVASGDFGFQLETRSGIDEIKDAYRSFNIMVEELDMINTLQRDFVSNVSHEFKTPINVIEGYLTLLRTPGLSEEERTFDVVVFTSEGLYGQPLSIASSYVAAFVLFGSFLSITGAGQWFIDMAFSLTGKYRSGPAMTAVVSSAAMGTISGTGVANVVTTGAFTIPLMKSCGYSPTMAGAVEATASTGGQIMPPVMGAGAFILADMIGVSYGEVAIASILPALLYFLACAFQVDFEAGRLGMTGLPADKLPKRWETFKSGWLYLLPVALLIWALCIKNYSANYSALYAIAAILVIGFVFGMKGERMDIKKVLQALQDAARDMLSVAMACATAGIMIGVLTKTGLGLKFTSLLLQVSGGMKLPTMVLTMICCIILGMGLPTTAAFIITATLCAPAIIELGITPMGAYMFVFYYACLSAITPPVALAAFAASGISGAKAMDTGLCATRLGLAGFLIPYFFCFTPAMLMQGNLIDILQVCVTSLIGIYLLAGGLEGYMWRTLHKWERVLLIAAALLMVDSGGVTDLIGIAIGAAIIVSQKPWEKRAARKAARS